MKMDILQHLTPFVVMIAEKRVKAGEELTPELMLECVKQAVDEDNKRCERMLRLKESGSTYDKEMYSTITGALSEVVYNSVPDVEPSWNPRWLECAKEKGVPADELSTVDYICWVNKAA